MTSKTKKLIILNIPYAVFGLLATKLGEGWRLAQGANASEKLLHCIEGLTAAFQSPLPSFVPFDLLIGIILGCLLKLIVVAKGKNAKKFVVDIDTAELAKPTVKPDLTICCSAAEFIRAWVERIMDCRHPDWLAWCEGMRRK